MYRSTKIISNLISSRPSGTQENLLVLPWICGANHVNLVRLYGFCIDAMVKTLVYVYMEHVSLDGYLFDLPPEKMGIHLNFLDIVHSEALRETQSGMVGVLKYSEMDGRLSHDRKERNGCLRELYPKPTENQSKVKHACIVYSNQLHQINMAISPPILPLAIVGVSMAGTALIVAIVAIYQCAKIALKRLLKDDRRPCCDHKASTTTKLDEASSEDANCVEVGSMTNFLEGIQKERPVRFSSQQLRTFTRNYASKVGSGGFGIVYKGSFPDGTPVAVKVLNTTLDRRAEEQFMAEVGTIGRTYHVNLVRLYGFCFDATMKALVYEYMEHGSLDGYLFDPPPEKMVRFNMLYKIAVGTAKALRYLHEECSQRIIHYDIKPQNVLLGAGLAPKVSDFGLARLCDREDTHLTITGARGTPGYAAPELWMPQAVTHKCDVYS
ncbi:hypothetical protein ACP70R_018022 [Stipagrostis hirtigluma subsp. patula]